MGCTTRITYHELYARRGFTALRRTWNRYQLFGAMLAPSPLHRLAPQLEAPAATENDLLGVHAPEYVDFIQQLDVSGAGKLDGSTPAWRGMYERAERVVGGSLFGADLISGGYADHVFNPAGGQHHAHRDRGGGFCVFNDVVAAIRRFQRHGYERIAVLDIDGHHGDGTESLLLDETILTISLHQFGERTYPGTGSAEIMGTGKGQGYTLNLPLPRGMGDEAYLGLLTDTVEPLLRAYRPQVLIVGFGTDAHAADPLLRLRLSTAAYSWVARWIHDLAHDLCKGRLLVLGGGGYEPHHVVRCWLIMLAELSGLPIERVHHEIDQWLAEPSPASDSQANANALLTAQTARHLVFPFHQLGPL